MTNYQICSGDESFLRLEIERTAAGASVLETLAAECDDHEIHRVCTRLAALNVQQVRRLQTLLLQKSGQWHEVPAMCPYVSTCFGTLRLVCLEERAGRARLLAYADMTVCPGVRGLCRAFAAERARAARALEALL